MPRCIIDSNSRRRDRGHAQALFRFLPDEPCDCGHTDAGEVDERALKSRRCLRFRSPTTPAYEQIMRAANNEMARANGGLQHRSRPPRPPGGPKTMENDRAHSTSAGGRTWPRRRFRKASSCRWCCLRFDILASSERSEDEPRGASGVLQGQWGGGLLGAIARRSGLPSLLEGKQSLVLLMPGARPTWQRGRPRRSAKP